MAAETWWPQGCQYFCIFSTPANSALNWFCLSRTEAIDKHFVMPNRYPLYGTRMFPKALWCLCTTKPWTHSSQTGHERSPTKNPDHIYFRFLAPAFPTTSRKHDKNVKGESYHNFLLLLSFLQKHFPSKNIVASEALFPLNQARATVGAPCVPSPFRPYLKHRFSQVWGMMVHLLSMPFAVCLLGNTLIKPAFYSRAKSGLPWQKLRRTMPSRWPRLSTSL